MVTEMNRGNHICTYTGKKFYPLNPAFNDVDIEDIAHALANITRFTGHTKEFYSVAQHSVLVSYECDQNDALAGLLHDASEAYISDIASPLKSSPEMKFYKIIENNIQNVVNTKFNLPILMPKSVKIADVKLLVSEIRDLMNNTHKECYSFIDNWDNVVSYKIIPLPPHKAKQLFLQRFYELTMPVKQPIQQLSLAF